MYDRAPREVLVPTEKCRWPGPGTYDVHLNTSFVEAPADNIVPFLSTSCRVRECSHDDSVGPNSYKLRSEFGNIPGGRFWISRNERFKETLISLPAKRKPEDALNLGYQEFDRPFKPIGSVKKRVKKLRKRFKREFLSTPSIPDRNTKYGYEYTEDGGLCKLPPPKRDNSMGPAYYDVPSQNTSLTSELYKGNFWSRRTGDNRFYPDSNPGPAHYNPHVPPMKELLHFPQEPLKISRYIESVVCKERKEDLPGPGYYSIADPLAMTLSDVCRIKVPFQSSSERFRENKRQRTTPGPTSYDDPRKLITGVCHFNQPELAPFGTTDERFRLVGTQSVLPAPNQYHLKGFAEENQTKNIYSKIIARSAAPAFGTSSDRPCQLQNVVLVSREWEIVKKETIPVIQPKSKPKPKRTCRRIPPKSTVPDPGDHDVAHVFDYLRKPTCHRRLAKGKIDRVGFLSASNRFSEPKVIKRPKKCRRLLSDGPGPGSYDVAVGDSDSCRGKGVRFSSSERFSIKRPIRWPTPATYKLAPSYHETMLKGTFNVTLDSALPRHFGAEWRPPHIQRFYCTQLKTSQFGDCVFRS